MNFREIAEKAGVSIATVSRVYNGKSGVGGEVRKRIESLLTENNYQISDGSRIDAKNEKLKIVTFVLYETDNSNIERNEDFFAGIILGAERRAKELGYLLSMVRVRDDDFGEFVLKSREMSMSSGMVLLATEVTPDKYSVIEKCSVPVVAIDNEMRYFSCNTICVDNEYGTYKAIEYLKSLGHEKIGLLAPLCPMGGLPVREKAYYKAMESFGLKADSRFTVRIDHALRAGIENMSEYLKEEKELPTAFFAANDTMGVAAMIALKQYGYSIPDDISIIGFDDANIGNSSEPRLSTMRADCADIGRYGVDRLSELINGDKSVMHIYMETPLVARGSTRAL